MSDLITLVYTSTAVRPLNNQELLDLLEQAREKNYRLNITGMLLYQKPNFLQVLEGSQVAVEDLFKSIVRDPRHHDVTLLLKRVINEREYTQWNMKFTNLDSLDLNKIPGYANFAKTPLNSKDFQMSNFTSTFLNLFKDRQI
jgi:hypothetical protein